MQIYALVGLGTWRVVPDTAGPFDGKTLEEAEKEVVLTLFPDLLGTSSPHNIIKAQGMELVPITDAHDVQYGRGT